MSDEAIQEEMMGPSRHWLDSGTGDLGLVHLEILEVNLMCVSTRSLARLDVDLFT